MDYLKLYDNFKEWITSHSLGLSKKTVKQYLFIVKKLLLYMSGFNIPAFKDFSYEAYARFVHLKPNKKPYSTSSINQRIAALDIFFSWAIEERWMSENENPVVTYKKLKIRPKRIDMPSTSEEISLNLLTEAEQAELMEDFPEGNFLSIRNHCMAVLILSTGLYAHEIASLTVDCFHSNHDYLVVGNGTTKERKIPLNSNLCKEARFNWEALRKNFIGNQEVPYYFFTEKLTPINTQIVYRSIFQRLKKCNIHKNQNGPDILRQTAIYNMLKEGYSFEDVSKITGITTAAQLQKYRVL